jgi:hypothetical protein
MTTEQTYVTNLRILKEVKRSREGEEGGRWEGKEGRRRGRKEEMRRDV